MNNPKIILKRYNNTTIKITNKKKISAKLKTYIEPGIFRDAKIESRYLSPAQPSTGFSRHI